jgi:hypothetical protein
MPSYNARVFARLFKGTGPTLLHDGPDAMAYYGEYELLKAKLGGPERRQLSPFEIVMGGVRCAQVKSRIQTATRQTPTSTVSRKPTRGSWKRPQAELDSDTLSARRKSVAVGSPIQSLLPQSTTMRRELQSTERGGGGTATPPHRTQLRTPPRYTK